MTKQEALDMVLNHLKHFSIITENVKNNDRLLEKGDLRVVTEKSTLFKRVHVADNGVELLDTEFRKVHISDIGNIKAITKYNNLLEINVTVIAFQLGDRVNVLSFDERGKLIELSSCEMSYLGSIAIYE